MAEPAKDATETTRSFRVVVKCCCQGCSKEIMDELVKKQDINKKKEDSHCCTCEYIKKKKKKKKHCCNCEEDEDEEEEEEESRCCKSGNEIKGRIKLGKQESTHRIEPYVAPRCDKRFCRDIYCTTHSERSIIRPSLIENPTPVMPPPFVPYYDPQKLPPSPLFFSRSFMMPPPHPYHTWAGSRRW